MTVKHCPFCSDKKVRVGKEEGIACVTYQVHCEVCGARGPAHRSGRSYLPSKAKEKAVKAWNSVVTNATKGEDE